MNPPEDFNKLFKDISPENVIFWTGAGISMAAPTMLPSGIILTEESMKKFMLGDTYDSIKKIFTSGNFKNAFGYQKMDPRLELIIQDAYGVLGFKTFDYFSFMNIPHEYLNRYHIFFASHILVGGTHFTMNFDDGIEKGMTKIDENLNPQIHVIDDPDLFNQKKIDFARKLIKLHGSITKKESYYRKLGLILNNIASGFDKAHSKKILKIIKNSKILCFIGYGGVDSFDVTPFFKKWIIKTELNELVVLWIEYADNQKIVPIDVSETKNAGPVILNAFKQAGANVLSFKGNAESGLIPFLTKKWNLNPLNVGTEEYKWKKYFDNAFKSHPIHDHLKRLIAGQYASALGIGKLAVDFTDPIRKFNLDTRPNRADGINISHQNQCWFVYTNGLRDLGEYSKAIKEIKDWKRRVHKTSFNYFFINYRLMGEYRIKRNLWRAFITGMRIKRMTKSFNAGDLNPDELFFIARFYVDYLHLHKNLWKLSLFSDLCTIKNPPVVFKTISKIWEKSIIDAWINAYSFNKKGINNPHIFSDIADLAQNHFKGIDYDYFIESARKKLPDFNGDLLQMGIDAFLETDSLLGDINSQRRQIDKDLCKYLHEIEDTGMQLKVYDTGIINEIHENLSKARSIWDYPGMWKAHFRLAKVCYALKEFDKASENAQKALDAIDKVSYNFFYKQKCIKQLKQMRTSG